MKTLDIVITHYNEPFEIVKPLLDSIQFQRNVDFNLIKVYFVNDGKEGSINPELFTKYTFDITFLVTEKFGISNARNAGFEQGNSDYVMFCDCDDTFYHVNAINEILQLAENNVDIIINNFYEEVIVGKEIKLHKHKNDEVFVHGKTYRRYFLESNNLKFNKLLTYHEDYYFNKLCITLTDNVIYSDEPSYLWTTRKDSICRKEPDYMQKTYNSLIDVNDCIIERFIQNALTNETIKLVVQFTFSTFFRLCTEEWQTSNYLQDTEKYFAKFFRKYRKYYDVCPVKDKSKWYEMYRSSAVNEGMLFEPITFLEWIKKILEVK